MSNLDEITDKSVRERTLRSLRKGPKGPQAHKIGAGIRAKVGKQGDNDPHRNNPKLHNEETPEKLKLAVIFLGDNITKSGDELTDAVALFKQKPELLELISHLIATSMGGWQQSEGCFVNDSGHKAYPKHWMLSEDKLVPIGREKAVDCNIDKLLEMKRIIEHSNILTEACDNVEISESDYADVFHYALKLSLEQCKVDDVPEKLKPHVFDLIAASR